MKKCLILLLILTAVMLLFACQSDPLPAPSGPASTVSPPPMEDGTVGTICADALLVFESGASDNPLVLLSYRSGQAYSFDITNTDALMEIYTTLLSVPLGSAAAEPGILDADIIFSFVRKNGEEFQVRFITPDYFSLYDTANAEWKFYEVPDSSSVRRCQDAAMAANREIDLQGKPLFGDMFALDMTQDVCARIDMDGNGQEESLFFDFIDNGDEAYGALKLSVDTADKAFLMNFYPATEETVFACGVPDPLGRTLLMITTDAEGGWPSCLFLITVKDGKLMQYRLEDVEITNYSNGVFTLSDQQTIDVTQIQFDPVAQ